MSQRWGVTEKAQEEFQVKVEAFLKEFNALLQKYDVRLYFPDEGQWVCTRSKPTLDVAVHDDKDGNLLLGDLIFGKP